MRGDRDERWMRGGERDERRREQLRRGGGHAQCTHTLPPLYLKHSDDGPE